MFDLTFADIEKTLLDAEEKGRCAACDKSYKDMLKHYQTKIHMKNLMRLYKRLLK